MRRETSFFRGSELPRLLVLIGVLAAGLLLFWQYGRSRPRPPAPPLVVEDQPRPVEPDRSVAFESVTDRTPMSLRDNAAYDLLIKRARERTPEALAAACRRDILMTHLWERPERYRGVPIHIDGTALRVLRYESKLSKTGWLYEAWIDTPDSGRFPYVCVSEDAPRGFPIGANVSERVVFNGYFLKIMKYEAANVARGAPLLVGRIGWDPSRSAESSSLISGSPVNWMLFFLGVMFVVTLGRWVATLGRSMSRRGRSPARFTPPNDQIDAATLEQWVRSASEDEATRPERPGPIEGEVSPEDSGARRPDEAQSTSSPATGG